MLTIVADINSGNKAVYFDDINIEPVLQINNTGDSNKDYVAKECRLYPASDSLTCFSNNDNVIKDGLEGYCLEHDQNNKNVCLMWYPTDNINSFKSFSNILGYKGKFPLNYCVELNGGFQVVEKRTAVRIITDASCDSGVGAGHSKCWFGWQNQVDYANAHPADFAQCEQKEVGAWLVKDANCGSYNYYLYEYCDTADTPNRTMICAPLATSGTPYTFGDTTTKLLSNTGNKSILLWIDNSLSLKYFTSSAEGWYPYDGFQSSKRVGTGNNSATLGGFNEAENNDPPAMIYTINPGDTEGSLKYISSKDNGANENNTFNFTCNKFIQTVDEDGQNKTWADRISLNSKYPTSTPAYFLDFSNNPYSIMAKYGRQREDLPFGAAVWPSDFNLSASQPIKFRSPDSKNNNETIFAGRPFGCTGDPSHNYSGCKNVGYCSLDPNVFCFYSDSLDGYFKNSNACANGGYGKCLALWPGSNPADYLKSLSSVGNGSNYQQILKTLFLKFYNGFSFNNGSYAS
ncbi:MAG: hypothetical protein NTX66_03235, partial [Candidatus Falkowbacteria bacterium]|nr:hypothetical protein [Candidatus Falkowbacteria bacterium]